MKLRSWIRLAGTLAVLALSLAVIACSGDDNSTAGGAAAKPQQETGDKLAESDASGAGGVLRIAMSAGNVPIPDQFLTEGGEGKRFVGANVYDTLLIYDVAQGDHVPGLIPGLAQSWTMADDKLTWTFKLRPNVKFHDGTPFNADAVIFALDRVVRKDFEFYSDSQHSAGASNLAQIGAYTKIDDMTVAITTKKPWAFLGYDLGSINIPSPTAIKTYGNADYPKHPVGTGPFKVTKYVDGQVMEMEPNKEYWGPKAKLDKLIVYPMPEPATRLAALQSGQVDWAEVPPPDSLKQLKEAGFNVLLKQYPHIITYMLNDTKAPFDNIKVRQALNYGVDRDGTVALINGVGSPATQYFYPGHPWRDDTFAGYTYDPAKAKQLLTEAGYPNGLKMTIAYPTGGSGNMFPGPMNEKFQQDMKAIGVDVTLVPLEWNTILSVYRAGLQVPENSKYDGIYFSPNTQTPLNAFASYLTERIPPAGCCNPMGYSNPKADAIFSQAAAEFDPTKQSELLKQFHAMFIRDAPGIVLVHDLNLRVLSPKVRGWVQPQSWWGNLSAVWVKP